MYLFVINEFYCVNFRIKWKWNLKNNPCTKKDFFSKCDKIRSLHLLKKSSMENFIFCGVNVVFEESLTHLFQKDDYMPCASWSFNLVCANSFAIIRNASFKRYSAVEIGIFEEPGPKKFYCSIASLKWFRKVHVRHDFQSKMIKDLSKPLNLSIYICLLAFLNDI